MAERLALAVVLLAAGSWVGSQLAPPGVAEWLLPPYALALVLGPGVVYAATRSVAASLAIPGLWLAKELYRVSGVYGPGATLYYALNPISVGLFTGAALQMALLEIARARRVTRGPALVLSGFAALCLGAFLVGRESGGREIFYGYIALYRRLFGE